jgi:hypothetical protein
LGVPSPAVLRSKLLITEFAEPAGMEEVDPGPTQARLLREDCPGRQRIWPNRRVRVGRERQSTRETQLQSGPKSRCLGKRNHSQVPWDAVALGEAAGLEAANRKALAYSSWPPKGGPRRPVGGLTSSGYPRSASSLGQSGPLPSSAGQRGHDQPVAVPGNILEGWDEAHSRPSRQLGPAPAMARSASHSAHALTPLPVSQETSKMRTLGFMPVTRSRKARRSKWT